MQKRLISLFLALVLVLSLAACGSKTETAKETEAQEPTKSKDTIPAESEPAVTEDITTTPENTGETVPEVPAEVVDTATLDEIEAQDTFAVRIVKKEGVKGAFDNNGTVIDPNGEDGYILTVENNTDATVSEIKFLILAIGNDGKGRDLGMVQSIQIDAFQMFEEVPDYNKRVKIMGTTGDLAAGSTFNVGVQCYLGDVAYMNVIVLSYVDGNGTVIYNENAATWLQNTVEK